MDFAEQLHILQAARESPALLALAMVDIVHHALPPEEQSRVKDALLAAAVPHWCDDAFLAELLGTTLEEGNRLLAHLCSLTVVEPFPARGEHAVNVHEATRLTLREHLRTTDATRWKTLSTRAFEHVRHGTQAHARIEALYHLFATDQRAAATACEALDREFSDSVGDKVRHALALALEELNAANWLTGAAKREALLAALEYRNSRGKAAQIEPEARIVVALARTTSHPSGVARAQGLLGDVFLAKGRHAAALKLYRNGLDIFQHLIKTDRSNANWRRDLAVAHSKIGDVADTQGHLEAALTAYRKFLACSQRLTKTVPSNTGWQFNVAAAYSRLGGIALKQDRHTAALKAFRNAINIYQRLIKTVPSNTVWRRELAIVHSHVGDVADTQGHLEAALTAYRKFLACSQRLAETDPFNTDWQFDLAMAYSRLGGIALKQGRLTATLKAYGKCLGLLESLVKTSPANVDWQCELALTHNRLGQAFQNMGNDEKAQTSFRTAISTMKKAIELSPKNANLKKYLVDLKSWPDSDE